MTGERFRVRAARGEDFDAIVELARVLDTVNLPHDPAALAELLERSEASFSGRLEPPTDRVYVFVLEAVDERRVVGASMIIGQLGTRTSPYVYFERAVDERYSKTLGLHFRHETLRIRHVYDGPTEIGGLVVLPELRAHPARLGRQVSYARFAWMAAHRADFRDEVLAELLPPRRRDGGNDFWDAVGHRFTRLDYLEADRLSRTSKDFIRELFPEAEIHLSLLPPEARALVGKVGPATEPARALLLSIGFEETPRVDPFDGGPHLIARTDAIVPIREAIRTNLREMRELASDTSWFVAHFVDSAPWMCAVRIPAGPGARIDAAARDLQIDETIEVLAIPLGPRK